MSFITSIVLAIIEIILAIIKIVKELLQFFSKKRDDTPSLEREVIRRIKEHLLHPEYERRSFKTILKKIGGYDENHDDLRKLLLTAGATRSGKAKTDSELWGFSREYRKKHIPALQDKTPSPFSLKRIIIFSITIAVLIGVIFGTYFYFHTFLFPETTCQAIFC